MTFPRLRNGGKDHVFQKPKTNMDTQNDGPWKRWLLFSNIGRFWGIYVRFLGGRTTPEPTLELFVAHALHTLLEFLRAMNP